MEKLKTKKEFFISTEKFIEDFDFMYETLASFAKESKMATLVGERTAGDGLGSDPMLIDLPNSGYILRFPKEMGITEKGSIIEFGSNSQTILNDDKAIITVLEQWEHLKDMISCYY